MNALNVFIDIANKKHLVGELYFDRGRCHFQYATSFLKLKLNLSPFKLQTTTTVQTANTTPFSGLHGLFADSLPDGWGVLLMDRHLQQAGIDHHNITPLQRLAYIGNKAMGALSYQPATGPKQDSQQFLDLTQLAQESVEIYQGTTIDVSEQLHLIGGSPGGARPKALIGLSGFDTNGDKAIAGHSDLPEGYEHWLIKYPTSQNKIQQYEGVVEYIYSILARKAGIKMPETKLIQAKNNPGYFAIKRFDRAQFNTSNNCNQKIHMHTLAGLIDDDFRVPDCDYQILLKATNMLTRSQQDNIQIITRMIFNIIMGNKDDHTKNFSYLMTPKGQWQLSPAYDITFNKGINGHHSMSVAGFGQNIEKSAVKKVADLIKLPAKQLDQIIEQVCDAANEWVCLAKEMKVPQEQIALIEKTIKQNLTYLI